jgi:Flp pilus assembly protein TadG
MSIRHVASELKTRLAAGSGGWRGSCRRFLRGENGAIAIYFGLSAIVFVGVAGLAVDAARGYLVKARLSEAIDAAALAGGKALQNSTDTDNAKVNAAALAFFKANFPDGAMGATVEDPNIVVGNNSTTVTVSSNAVIPTTLMSVLGFQNMKMTAAATVARAQSGLDVVFSFDVSGSMCDPCSKIDALKSNAKSLVTSLYKPFTDGVQQQQVTVNGTTYSLLNIGIVPWSAKVNVRTHGKETGTDTVTTQTVSGYNDPTLRTTGLKTTVFKASTTEVPLLYNPNSIGGWKGCVYARYMDDGNQTNDADTSLGSVTVGNKTWPAWEPIPTPEGDTSLCDAMFWNAGNSGSWSGKSRPAGWPNPPSPVHQFFDTCVDCPKTGILPLQLDKATVDKMIDDLKTGGATIAPQGLFWAWEVLMPGEPFSEAKLNPPFQRAQAIVFMTDGYSEGQNGDAYHGWFGDGGTVGTTTSKGDMTLPDGSTVKNNLNNRLRQVAAKIKGSNPQDPSSVKIYVIQYKQSDSTLVDLLKEVATQPNAPYYFFAPDDTALEEAFKQIAASLSALRLVQ